jgi:hypothetical protein
MTKRQIQKIQCRVRRGVNRLYGSYLTSVLQRMKPHDRAGEIDQALAAVSHSHRRQSATPRACRPVSPHREMKLRADLSSARLRERLWQVQHLQLDPCATGFP